MAHIKVIDYIDVGTGGYHNATSYQIAKDPEFEKIIDQSLKDTVNVNIWHSMLPKLDEDKVPGEPLYYADASALYGRVKVWVDDFESRWFNTPVVDQNVQDVIITEEGKEDIITTSTAIGMV